MSSVELGRVVERMSELASAGAGGVGDGELGDQLRMLRRLADMAEAAYTERLGRFDRRGVAESERCLSTRAWVRHELHVAPGETARTLKLARGLRELPVVAEAYAQGTIRRAHVAAIVDATSLLGADVVAGCQDALSDIATLEDPTRLRAVLRGYGAAVDSPNAVKQAEKQAERQWLDVSCTFDGSVYVQGMFGPEDGAALKATIEAHTKPFGVHDHRTASQRRADALIELCHHRGTATPPPAPEPESAPEPEARPAARSGATPDPTPDTTPAAPDTTPATAPDTTPATAPDTTPATAPDTPGVPEAPGEPEEPEAPYVPGEPGVPEASGVSGAWDATPGAAAGGPAPGGGPVAAGGGVNLMVVTDLATLEARAGGFGELPDGSVLRGDVVRRLACEATITRVITGPNSQPLDVGRTQRSATAAQRRALHVRDGGCRFPGCDRPSAWADVHHVKHWAHGGQTNLDNMILLCRKHHTAVHEGGWTIHALGHARFLFTNPRGQLMIDRESRGTRHLIMRLVHLTSKQHAGPAPAPDSAAEDRTWRQRVA